MAFQLGWHSVYPDRHRIAGQRVKPKAMQVFTCPAAVHKTLVKQARFVMEHGDAERAHHQASAWLQQATQQAPDDAEPLAMLARSLFEQRGVKT